MEAVMGTDQGEDREEGVVVVGSAESDEVEVMTQENTHLHPIRLPMKKLELLEMSLRCGIRYERWSGDTPREWKIGRLVQIKIEVYVMTEEHVSSRIKKRVDEQPK